jgi:hypothetical protein
MKLDTVWKWWNRRRSEESKKCASQGIMVRPLSYDDLSEREQEIVYNCWLDRQLAIR